MKMKSASQIIYQTFLLCKCTFNCLFVFCFLYLGGLLINVPKDVMSGSFISVQTVQAAGAILF